MKKIYTLLFAATLFTLAGFSQTTHNVEVSSNQFSPSDLTINAGDIVIWTNVDGFHNVDGNLTTFPNNPETFGNEPSSDNWTYEFTFNTIGVYGYQCVIHPNEMQATITVEAGPLNVEELAAEQPFAFFPNPVVNELSWKWSNDVIPANSVFSLYNAQGKLVDQFTLSQGNRQDVSGLSKGLYTYSVRNENEQVQSGKLLIERR